MIALIDADILLYRASWKHEGGRVDEMYETIDDLFNGVFHATGAEKYIGFLTGRGNFRKDVAFTREYKGNRKKLEKPQFFYEAREYFIDKWDCIVVNGMEADDALGICQMEISDDTCICTIDKDLDCITGLHYNWGKRELYDVSEDLAEYNHWIQVLMGDSTDNIVGIPKVGKVKAERIIDELCFTEGLDYYTAVLSAYKDAFEDEEQAMLLMQETQDLVGILSSLEQGKVYDFKIPTPNYIF